MQFALNISNEFKMKSELTLDDVRVIKLLNVFNIHVQQEIPT